MHTFLEDSFLFNGPLTGLVWYLKYEHKLGTQKCHFSIISRKKKKYFLVVMILTKLYKKIDEPIKVKIS